MHEPLAKRPALSLLLVLALAGCASTSAGGASASPGKPDAAADKARELQAAESKLALARARREKLDLEQGLAETQHETKLRHARAAVESAEAALARFRDADAPTQLASQRLDLQSAKDRAQEAAEELAQIEIMYKDQDLDDLTAEFVVSRGRRSAERAQARIEIEAARLQALEEREQPQRQRELELAVDKAAADLAAEEMQGEIDRRARDIARQEADDEIARLEQELADLKAEVEP